MRLSSQGAPIGNEFPISTATNSQVTPAIVGGPASQAFVIWSDQRNGGVGYGDIYGTRLTVPMGSAAPLINDPDGIPISSMGSEQLEPALAYDRVTARYLAAWSDARASNTNRDIYGTLVDVAGIVQQPNGFPIATAANRQEAPAITYCNGRYLIAWVDTRSYSPGIRFAITDAASPPNVLVNNVAVTFIGARTEPPAVTCDGTDFYIAWATEGGHINGRRIFANGSLGVSRTISNTGTSRSPAIAYQGCAGQYLVAFEDNRNGHYDIFSRRITSTGDVTGAEVNVSGVVTGDQVRPAVTWDNDVACAEASRFFVVWQDGRAGGEPAAFDIWGRYQTTSGALSTSIQITAAGGGQTNPRVATRPNTRLIVSRSHLVVWEGGDDGGEHNVLARVVTPSGTLGNFYVIASQGAEHETEPDVAQRSDGAMVVTYRRSALAERFNYDIYGQDVDMSTASFVQTPFVISAEVENRERSAAVRCGSSTRCQTVYRVLVDRNQTGTPPPPVSDPSVGADRVRGRMLEY